MADAQFRAPYPGSDTFLDALTPLDVRPRSLTEMVYESIRDAIVTKRLPPGTVVAESSLAARLQVSKTPVREALLRLQSIGLVESDGARGLRVVQPSEDVIRQAYEVRMALEAGLSRLAAERATLKEQVQIREVAERSMVCAKAGDVADGFRRWDRAFHKAISVAAATESLARLAEDAAALSRVLRERDVPEVEDAIQCGMQHVAIADAIAKGDGDLAAHAGAEHVSDVKAMVLAAFRDRFAAGASALAEESH